MVHSDPRSPGTFQTAAAPATLPRDTVEMKSIVLGFAGLVKPMVETIDRRGLKDVETFARPVGVLISEYGTPTTSHTESTLFVCIDGKPMKWLILGLRGDSSCEPPSGLVTS
jgi:hypothetical protein